MLYIRKKQHLLTLFGVPFLIGIWMVFGMGACSDDSSSSSFSDGDVDADTEPEPVDFYAQCSDFGCDEFGLVTGELDWGVPTWHKHDPGIGFVGDPVILTVADENAGPSSHKPRCYVVRIMTHGEEGATFHLELDSPDNRENIHVSQLDGKNWALEQFEFRAPTQNGTMHFNLRKAGAGEGILYFMDVDGVFICSDKAMDVN